MLIALLPVIFAIVGALAFAMSKNPDVKELGRLLFAAGAFAVCFTLAGRMIHLL